MTELTKEDWQDLKTSSEKNLKAYMIGVLQFQNLLELAEKELAEFPDETKEVEKEIEKVMDDKEVPKGS